MTCSKEGPDQQSEAGEAGETEMVIQAVTTETVQELTHVEKAAVRTRIFQHLAGIVVAPVVKALADRGVFAQMADSPAGVSIEEIVARTGGNRGYLRVALRLLVSCGWMAQARTGESTLYSLTPEGKIAVWLAPLHGEVVSFIPKALFLDDFLFGKSDKAMLSHLQDLVRRARERWGIYTEGDTTAARVHRQTVDYLDGMLVGPAMVALAREGVLGGLDSPDILNPSDLPGNPRSLACVFDLLALQGWIARDRDRVFLTATGRYAAQIATSYGVTVSYLPLFHVLPTLLFGNANIPRIDESGGELLVNRGMNVWGSGGAHNSYFKKSDDIIIELFNRPLSDQPRGVCDMGCGDGSFLEHVYYTIVSKTRRGAVLEAHPLVMIGADVSKVARRITKQRLRAAGIPEFHVIRGDINRPAYLASELERLGLDIHHLLHIRSFLDHNRPYLPPANYSRGSRAARTTGAFAYLGEEIPPDEMEENMVRHLRRWAPYVGRFGLLVMELHTLPPELTAANLDRTLAVAYDGTHGFSDQYLLEHDVFLACAREAGLAAEERFQAKFPPSELATVSINFFKALG
ncbi:MAG TPA: class I SAM-dependent methyltransferase [Blastocatellia bacterium]|nr:class I SAM-dependent methyltransferase [Blastocatellia bacterium]